MAGIGLWGTAGSARGGTSFCSANCFKDWSLSSKSESSGRHDERAGPVESIDKDEVGCTAVTIPPAPSPPLPHEQRWPKGVRLRRIPPVPVEQSRESGSFELKLTSQPKELSKVVLATFVLEVSSTLCLLGARVLGLCKVGAARGASSWGNLVSAA
jgi:hypothetical protein